MKMVKKNLTTERSAKTISSTSTSILGSNNDKHLCCSPGKDFTEQERKEQLGNKKIQLMFSWYKEQHLFAVD